MTSAQHRRNGRIAALVMIAWVVLAFVADGAWVTLVAACTAILFFFVAAWHGWTALELEAEEKGWD